MREVLCPARRAGTDDTIWLIGGISRSNGSGVVSKLQEGSIKPLALVGSSFSPEMRHRVQSSL